VRKIEPINSNICVNFNITVHIYFNHFTYIYKYSYIWLYKAMPMLKVIILLLIISSTCKSYELTLLTLKISISISVVIDARARRKRRQISSASYYISNVNPYSSSFDPTAPLTYSSGSYYSAPSYGYPNTGYSGDQPYRDYNGNGVSEYSPGYAFNYNSQYPSGSSQTTYQFPNFGSTYGSGLYGNGVYGNGLYGNALSNYAAAGFNNQYPNWNQGNNYQYYTGGTGSGLSNTGYAWYRGLRNVPFRGQAGGIPPANPAGLNPPMPIRNPGPGNAPGK
jgi:hypothetical protein